MHETCGRVFGVHASFHTLPREVEKERRTLLISSLNFHVVTKHLYVDIILIMICFTGHDYHWLQIRLHN